MEGFTFNGVGTPITMVNDGAYANRDGALVDDTGKVGLDVHALGLHGRRSVDGARRRDVFELSFLCVEPGGGGSTDVEWARVRWGQRRERGILRRIRRQRCRCIRDIRRSDVDGGRCRDDDRERTPIMRAQCCRWRMRRGFRWGRRLRWGIRWRDVGVGISGMDQCGAGCDVAFDVAHILHEYGCAGHPIHRQRDGGDAEHQRADADDHALRARAIA